MLAALHEPMHGPRYDDEAHAAWWKGIAWNANKLGSRRITLEEVSLSCAAPASNDKGPGGETGPYQTLVVPYGWSLTSLDRDGVREPDQACTQHVGDAPADSVLRSWDNLPPLRTITVPCRPLNTISTVSCEKWVTCPSKGWKA